MKNSRLVVYGVLLIIFFGGFLFAVRAQAQFRARWPQTQVSDECDTSVYFEVMRLDNEIEKLYGQALLESNEAFNAVLRDDIGEATVHLEEAFVLNERIKHLIHMKGAIMEDIVLPDSSTE